MLAVGANGVVSTKKPLQRWSGSLGRSNPHHPAHHHILRCRNECSTRCTTDMGRQDFLKEFVEFGLFCVVYHCSTRSGGLGGVKLGIPITRPAPEAGFFIGRTPAVVFLSATTPGQPRERWVVACNRKHLIRGRQDQPVTGPLQSSQENRSRSSSL